MELEREVCGAAAARDPYGRHVFVGGNTLLPALLRDHADALRPNADAAAFDAVIASVRAQLAERTATVGLTAKRIGDALHIDVSVHNLAGHKFGREDEELLAHTIA